MALNERQRKKVSSGRITDAAEVMTEQTLNLIKHILLKHETAQLEVMAEMKEEIMKLQQLHDELRSALENCRLLAARKRKEEWAGHILRFCGEAGVKGEVTR